MNQLDGKPVLRGQFSGLVQTDPGGIYGGHSVALPRKKYGIPPFTLGQAEDLHLSGSACNSLPGTCSGPSRTHTLRYCIVHPTWVFSSAARLSVRIRANRSPAVITLNVRGPA